MASKVLEEDANLPYYHGALMNVDADQLLVNEGDFMITMKLQLDINRMVNTLRMTGSFVSENCQIYLQFYLAVRLRKCIRRYEIKRTPTSAKLATRTAPSIEKLIDSLKENPIEIKGEKVFLKRPIPKGKFQLNHKDVIFKKKIGAGAYGTVYLGRLVKTDEIIAVKKLNPEDAEEDGLAEMMKEARVMQLYDHENIVKFYGFVLDDHPYLLVLQYCNGGAVEDALKLKGHRLKPPVRVDYTVMASRGIEYLHKKNCLHRDIGARNCLIHNHIVKIADFGMCRAQTVYKIDVSKPCNVRWIAPEIWDNGETRFSTDIYAFGVMMWEFFERPYRTPYSEMRAAEVKRRTRAGYRLPVPKLMPDLIAAIMAECWHQDPEKRPNAERMREKLEEAKAKLDGNSTTVTTLTGTVSKSKTIEIKKKN